LSTFYITKHEINEGILSIQTEETLSPITELQIILQDRSSKKDYYYQPQINKMDNNITNINLDLSTVTFLNNNKNRFDLYFSIDQKKVRVQSKLVYLKNNSSRYSTDFFYIKNTNTNIAIPYLTVHNNLSILYGNASIILKEFCHDIWSSKPIEATLIHDNEHCFLEIHNFPLDHTFSFIALYNENDEVYESLDYTLDYHAQKVYLNNIHHLSQNAKLVIQAKKRNNLLTFPIVFTNNEKSINNEIHTNKQIIRNHLSIHNVTYENNIISFNIPKLNINEMNTCQIYLKSKNKQTYFPEVNSIQHGNTSLFQIDLSTFITDFSPTSSRWKIYMKIENDFYIEINRLGIYDSPPKPRCTNYLYDQNIINSRAVIPYFTHKNGLSIVIKSKIALHHEILRPVTSVNVLEKTKRNRFYVEMTTELNVTENYIITSLFLKHRSKIEHIEHSFELVEKKISKNKSHITLNLDVTNLVFESGHWDVYLVIQMNNIPYLVRVKNPIPELSHHITNKENKHIINMSNRFMLYPYITQNDGLSFTYRKKEKHEGMYLNIKEKLAFYIANKFKNYFDKKQIWLVYEKFSETAQDNSYYFFKHVYEKHPDINIFYIIDKKSSDFENVKNMKNNVIPYMSLKHLVYLITCKVLISSESKGHAYILKKQNGRLRNIVNEKKFVFLRHGVSGFKNVNYIYMKDGNNSADLIVASSKKEKNIVINNMQYNDEDVVITGLCRWDALLDNSKSNSKKEIIIMPTWRTWLDDVSEEKFLNSDYYKHYTNLLNSNKLNKLLLENDIIIHFFIHPKLKAYISNFHTISENIRIYEFGEIQINHLLMRSSLLITDYSSVSWDFYYLKKPVIFYQFDYETYERVQGSYLDMNTELFGDRAFDENNLINLIKVYVERSFMEKEKYATQRKEYFQYIDQNNCERTFNEIIKNKDKLSIEPY